MALNYEAPQHNPAAPRPFDLYAWLDSPLWKRARRWPCHWYRVGNDLYSVNRAGRVYSHAAGRLPLDCGYVALPDGAVELTKAEVEPTGPVWRKHVGLIGYGGGAWTGEGWSDLHQFLTQREHEALAKSLHWGAA
ncbi:MAG: hypothetical protein AMXMBFR64_04880 [Myxococcales bacterium]